MKTMFRRFLALVSAIFILAGGTPMTISAENENARPSSTTIDIGSYSRQHTLFYADQSASQKLHLILPEEGDGPYPLIVFVHGGSFSMGNSSGSSVLYTASGPLQAVSRGYAVALVDYRYWPEAFFPSQIYDVKAAIRYLRANAETYHLKTDPIALWGESAGGLIADLTGLTNGNAAYEDLGMGNAAVSSEVQAVVSWYAITDMTTAGNAMYAEALLGSHKSDTLWLQKASPLYQVSENAPAFYLQHGTGDVEVSHQDSVNLYNALKSATGNPLTKLELFAGIGHAVNRFLSADNVCGILDWLEKALDTDFSRPMMAVSLQSDRAVSFSAQGPTAGQPLSDITDYQNYAFSLLADVKGGFRLFAEGEQACLTVTQDGLALAPYTPDDSQLFSVDRQSEGYEIRSVATGKALALQQEQLNIRGEGETLFRLINVTIKQAGNMDPSLDLTSPLVASCAGSGLLVKLGDDGYLDSDCLLTSAVDYTENIWQLTKEQEGFYSIRFFHSGKYLTESNNLLTVSDEFTASDSQLFSFTEEKENTYRIVCKRNGFLISEAGGGTKDVHTYPECGVDAQRFVLQNVDPNGEVVKVPEPATVDLTQKVAALFGAERKIVEWKDGLYCQTALSDIDDPAPYAWSLEESSSGDSFRIGLADGSYLSVAEGEVVSADYNSASEAQLWKLIHMDANTYQISNLFDSMQVLYANPDGRLGFLHRKLASQENSLFELLNVSDGSYSKIALHYHETDAPYGLVGRWFETESNGTVSYTTINAGSEVYFRVENTSTVQIHIDVENNVYLPYYAYQIDEGELIRLPATQTELPILLSKGRHIVRIVVDGLCEHENKWQGNTGFTFVKAVVEDGGAIAGVTPQRRTVMFFGDSITEGVNALSNGAVATSNAASKSYAFFCAEALGAVSYRIGFGASGVTKGGSGGVPKCLEVIDQWTGSIPAADPVPDVIVINHGFNDTAASESFTAEYRAVVSRLREKYPATPIFCVSPFYSRSLRSEDIQAAIQGIENAFYIDGGILSGSFTTDGVHPNATGGQICGEYLADQLKNVLGSDFFALEDIAWGDPNGDGSIDASDALLALQHSVGLIRLEGSRFTAADVDENGTVNAADALAMLQYSVGILKELPIR